MKNKKEYMMYAIMKVLEENYQLDLSTISGLKILRKVEKEFEKKCFDKELYFDKAKDYFERFEMKGNFDMEGLLSSPYLEVRFYGKLLEIDNKKETIMIHIGKKGEILISKVLARTENEI